MEIESVKAKFGASVSPIEAISNEGEVKKEDSKTSQRINEDEKVIELSPNGRYGKLNTILGKGAFKFVWKAIDIEEGYEVAWNTFQVSIFI
jgi:hypothetical protein